MKQIEMGSSFRPRIIATAGLYLGLATLVFFLAFCNLDSRPFWGDEAETALLARNVLKFGVPKVDDGVNHISIHGDRFDARDGVWTWSPWLQDYIAAGSFAVFGQTTWAGRAPFTFIGWLAVIALGFAAWQIYRSHCVALAAMLLLGTSEVFLLHIRQCRYYSITVLAQIVLVYGLYQIFVKNKSGSWFILAGLLVQFYCNYTCAIANGPVLVWLALRLFSQDRGAFRRLLLCFGIFILLTVPWLLFSEIWRQGSAEGRDIWMHLIRFYAWQFHFHFFPWCFVLLPICGWAVCTAATWRVFGRWFRRTNGKTNQASGYAIDGSPKAPAIIAQFEHYLVGLIILYVPVLLIMPLAFSRYLLPLLPIACLLVAVWLFRYIKWTAVVCVILMVQCLTNLLAVATDPFGKEYPMRSPFADVLFSSLLPYADRLTDLLKFFHDNARPADTVLSWDPEFPLAFYTYLKIVDGRLTRDPFQPLPNWILPESATGDLYQKHELPEALKSRYEKITVKVHNSTQVDTIPEPEAYELQTAGSMTPFVIYRLKNEH
ncbi:MAG TPA: glycosyltransferase family 39 protein [Verrucomicrobiae bacterium]|nr:glycosyltransferase family 39 protein [Verrucomicrobiae bacterium]